jgi:hypothetical protein
MDKPKTGFSQIPNQLIYDQNLSNEAKMLFIYIKSLSANYRILRNSNLSKKIGVSLNTLQNAKNELIKNGYLFVHRLSSANKYELRLPKINVKVYPKSGYNDYPKSGLHYKDNTSPYNTNINKGFKGFKKVK